MYGGWDGQAAHNTLHKLNTVNLTWQEMKSGDGDETPMKMSGCGLVAKGSNELVLFGGYGVPATAVASKQKSKNVSLLTTTTSNSGRSSRQSKDGSNRRGSGAKSSLSQEDTRPSSTTPSGNGKKMSEERQRKRSEKARREQRVKEGHRPRSGRGSRQSIKEDEKESKLNGYLVANGSVAGGEGSIDLSSSNPTSPETPAKKEKDGPVENSSSSGSSSGNMQEEGEGDTGKINDGERKVNGEEVSADEGKGNEEDGKVNSNEGKVNGDEPVVTVPPESEVIAVQAEIHDQQDNVSDKSEKKLIIADGEGGTESKEKSEVEGSVPANGDTEKDVKNQEIHSESINNKVTEEPTRNGVDPPVTASSGEEPTRNGVDPPVTASSGEEPTRNGVDPPVTASSGEEPTRNGVDPPVTASSGEGHETAKSDVDKPLAKMNGLSAEEKLGQGEITMATDTRPASQAEREDALTVVGEVLTMMEVGQEEGKAEESHGEEVVVVNKKWTNELKVYNISTGKEIQVGTCSGRGI